MPSSSHTATLCLGFRMIGWNGMAFRKADTELRDYANTFIEKIVASGELSKINEKWFGFPLGKLPPMPEL